MASKQPLTQDYLILQSFRLGGRWHHPESTIALTPSQASMLLLNGKVSQPNTTQPAESDE
ncbi:hypothetical protein [Celerinatantimonas sp. MCCC 1A17872]|uniref:hypothetical protein n=1 Tax=Celerinatantimonas sp. MCCC 1A17872 TaxID=3177514 RepID=UPI0038CBFA55